MEITKEFLQKEYERLTQMKDQHLYEANACQGAAQMCQELIKKLEEPEQEEAPDVKDLFPPGTEFEVTDNNGSAKSD